MIRHRSQDGARGDSLPVRSAAVSVRFRVPAGWWLFATLALCVGVGLVVDPSLRSIVYQPVAPIARPLALRGLLTEVGPSRGSPIALATREETVVTVAKYVVAAHGDGEHEVLLTSREAQTLVGGRAVAFSSAAFDSDGRLWVGTWRGGVLVRDRGRWRKRVGEEGSPLGQVVAFAPSRDGMLIASGGGLFRFSEAGPVAEISGERIVGLQAMGDGRILAATRAEIRKREGDGTWRFFHDAGGRGVTALRDGGGGQLLVGTRDGFLRLDAPGTDLGGSLEGHWIRDFAWDRGGHLWVATWDAGLAWSDGEGWQWLGAWEALPDLSVSFVHVDDENQLWMGLYGDRIYRLDLSSYLSLEGAG